MSAANQDQERRTKNEATEDHTASNRNDSAARRSVGQTSEDAPPPARHPVTEEDHADRDYALFEAERFFNQLGSKFADTAAKCMVRKMEEAQAPYALMYKVVRHAKRQVDHQNSISNRAAYLTTCTERLITRAMKKQWQLAALIAEDERAWEKSKKGSAKAPQPHQDDRVSLSDMVDISRQVWG